MNGFASRKKLQVIEKKFFDKKKFIQLICKNMIFKTVSGHFCKQMGLKILKFRWF